MSAQLLGIIGLQRIGSSVGLAFKQSSLTITIAGHDRDRSVMKKSNEMGAIDKSYTSVANLIADADILVLTEPLSQLEETLKLVGKYVQEHTVIVDFAPSKTIVQSWATQYLPHGHYVAFMPIAHVDSYTDIRQTVDAADANLFRNSVVCMMPGAKVDEGAVQTASNIGHVLGCEPFFVDQLEYDAYMQALETVPHLLSVAFFRSLVRTTGWRDMNRFAGSSFAQLTNILAHGSETAPMILSDEAASVHWIDAVMEELADIRYLITQQNHAALSERLMEVADQRERWIDSRRRNSGDGVPSEPIETPRFMEQMLGSRLFGRGKKKK